MMEYKAIDGKLFETEYECKEYESNPVIWIVKKQYPFLSMDREIDRIFLLESDAEKYVKDMDNKLEQGIRVIYIHSPFVVEPYKPTPKPQTTVFNTTKPYVDSRENKEKRLSIWGRILKVLS